MRSVLLFAALAVAVSTGPLAGFDDQLTGVRRAVMSEVQRKAEAMSVNAVRCLLGDELCVKKARREKKPVVITDRDGRIITDDQGQPVRDQAEAARVSRQAGGDVWRNYDFVPGSTVWRATDFSNEPVGRFPASQLEFVSGNLQIVEFESAKVLEATSNSVVKVKLPQVLPKAFTVEFSLRIPTQNIATLVFTSPRSGALAKYPFDYVYIYHTPGIYRMGKELTGTRTPALVGATVPVKLQVRDEWAILYVGADRVAQVPTANFGRSDSVEFHLSANARFPTYLSDIVVAVGLDSLYEALSTTGEYTTRGILFDSNSDRLRPESTPVLQALVTAFTEHGDLRVQIEGHTDGQGEDTSNQALSERRAAAVVAYLTDHGIQAGRLQSVGKGESVPVGDNATAEGRQQNRRVVIRRLS
jgi:outer membrane protein OmpA-like peptidoglycan-associated protein